MLEIKDLHVKFHTRDREAVGGISFSVADGEIVGLVGESGSGKTVTAMSIGGLLDREICDARGEVTVDGVDVLSADDQEMRKIKGKLIGVVFQEPFAASDPLMKIGKQVEEVLRIHTDMGKAEIQRAMIAAAIVIRPKLLLLDEPTTALDVTTQREIIDLLIKLNETCGTAMLFISHDLNVVRRLCDRVVVMKRGAIVEEGETEAVFNSPKHDYTKTLLRSIPSIGGGAV